MQTSSKTAGIGYIYKSIEFNFSTIVVSHMYVAQNLLATQRIQE